MPINRRADKKVPSTKDVKKVITKVVSDLRVVSNQLKHRIDYIDDQIKSCDLCALSCSNRVTWRGEVPADVVFIGESPGANEAALGVPFIGPSGSLLKRIIEDVQKHVSFRYFLTNSVMCEPPVDDHSGKIRAPTRDESTTCMISNVKDYLVVIQPRIVVTIGELAKVALQKSKIIEQFEGMDRVHMKHPSWMLRQKDMHYHAKKATHELIEAFKAVFDEE